MTHPSQSPPRPRRWLRRSAAVLFLLLVIGGGTVGFFWHRNRADLARIEADCAAVDPALTLAEVEVGREQIPDEQNGALRAAVAGTKLLPRKIDTLKGPLELSPPIRLSDEQIGLLCGDLTDNADALAEAQKLIDLPRGRFVIGWATPVWTTNMMHAQSLRGVNNLLVTEGLMAAEAGDLRTALRDTHAALNAGRALGDEPLLISQLVRTACQGRTLTLLERALAQGEAPEAQLAAFQKALEDERQDVNFLAAFRGERALQHETMQDIREGKISLSGMTGAGGTSWEDQLKSKAAEAWALTQVDFADAWLLRRNTMFIEIFRKPADEWYAAAPGMKLANSDAPQLASLLGAGLDSTLLAAVRNKARVRCSITMLALERYRLANGHWPQALDELCPTFLTAVPNDPYDRQPLRYRKTEDGVMVYSVGPDQADNGGSLDRTWKGNPGSDTGYQLWNVARRRQPPANPPAAPVP